MKICKWYLHHLDCLDIIEHNYCSFQHDEPTRKGHDYRKTENSTVERLEEILNEDPELFELRSKMLRYCPAHPNEFEMEKLRIAKKRKEDKTAWETKMRAAVEKMKKMNLKIITKDE